jgi:hypothetical protein
LDGVTGEHGAGHPDQKHVDHDAEPNPQRIFEPAAADIGSTM